MATRPDGPQHATAGGAPEVVGAVAAPPVETTGLPWRRAVALGLILAGVCVVVAGSVLEVQPARRELPRLASWGSWFVGAILLAASLGVRLETGERFHPWGHDEVVDRSRARRRWLLFGALTSAGVAVGVGWEVRADVAGGLPTLVLPLITGGLVLVAVGCALLIGGPARGPSPWWSRRRAALFGAVAGMGLLGAGGAFAVASVVVSLPIDATVATGEVDPPDQVGPSEVDASATPVAWTWDAPEGASIHPSGPDLGEKSDAIVAAGPGLAVRVADGVVALDGRTGEERWRYRRTGAEVYRVTSSPSGEWVVVTFVNGGDGAGQRVVALDGRTGEAGIDEVVTTGSSGPSSWALVTGSTVLHRGAGDGEHVARSLDDGRELWRWEPPAGCALPPFDAVEPAASTLLVALVCLDEQPGADLSGEVVLLGVDPNSGEERWRREEPFASELPDGERRWSDPAAVKLDASVDGAAALVEWQVQGAEGVLGESGRRFVVDTATGEVVADHETIDAVPGLIGSLGTDAVASRVPEDGRLVHRRQVFATGEVATIDGSAGMCTWADRNDAAVEICEGSNRTTVAVIPWDDPGGRREHEIDLGDRPAGYLPWPVLASVPEVTVAYRPGGTRVLGLR